MLDVVYHGMMEDIYTKEQPGHGKVTEDMKNLDFQIMLTINYYTNPNSMHICFPMKIKQKIDEDNNIDTDLITVNNFFAHLVKGISVTRYGKDKQLMPTFLLYEVYQYSDSMLKHLPKNTLKKIEKTMLYSKQPVYFNRTTLERRTSNSATANGITDLNINERVIKFQKN